MERSNGNYSFAKQRELLRGTHRVVDDDDEVVEMVIKLHSPMQHVRRVVENEIIRWGQLEGKHKGPHLQ